MLHTDCAGARIDHGHHENTARRALEEVLAMDAAVARALEHVNLEETLVVVTADHSHPLTIGSYATRGNPILGEALQDTSIKYRQVQFHHLVVFGLTRQAIYLFLNCVSPYFSPKQHLSMLYYFTLIEVIL